MPRTPCLRCPGALEEAKPKWGKMNEPEKGRFPGSRYEPRTGAVATSVTMVTSASLFQGGREVLIRHGDEVYRLRSTSKGKLILTK